MHQAWNSGNNLNKKNVSCRDSTLVQCCTAWTGWEKARSTTATSLASKSRSLSTSKIGGFFITKLKWLSNLYSLFQVHVPHKFGGAGFLHQSWVHLSWLVPSPALPLQCSDLYSGTADANCDWIFIFFPIAPENKSNFPPYGLRHLNRVKQIRSDTSPS